MIDATIKTYATRQLGGVALAIALVIGLVAATSVTDARTVSGSGGPAPQPGPQFRPGNRPLITGIATVVDGDTLIVGETRIRLEGIDAPEMNQTCLTRMGQSWPCGRKATSFLARMVQGREITCEDRGLDKYRRTLGTCFIGGRDISAEMVRQGYAWAFVKYSTAYVALEAEAKRQHAGIWEGDATPAWDYRAGRWETAEAAAPQGCAIKGNVTANGRIYHMPWSPWYEKVKMDGGAQGKRWFCTEAEAAAAGWRPAQGI